MTTQAYVPGRIAPDTRNLLIGKGFALFQPNGTGAYYHLGNCPKMAIAPKSTLLEHFDDQAGVKQKDLTVVTQQTLDFTLDMEEIAATNMALLMGGFTAW